MAIELFSENSGTGGGGNMTMSPRISFSHDLSQSDTVPVEQLLRSFSSSSSTVDFNFCVQQNPNNPHASMADELFSNGKIIPTQIKHHPPPPPPPPPSSLPPQSPASNYNPLPAVEEEQHNSSKSFWGFKRSSSCGNGYARSLCPIPLLSRSNSAGSSTSTKRSSSSKEGSTHKHPHNSQKPPLRKTSYSYGNNSNSSNGVRVNPVLNLGFGSFFSNGKKK
ncbi:uncharacterized protein LOC111919608 [Lactuca sativa]|uniref:Uncharacterized protein n=1 Tax=Lactuca sativa TaxID=4236 RepID=A0A9R1W224_LACSA|nr:uncharacterized protein LOC111919608 [Lactuca sativa]KAJ0215628.1 hypothetical protein LSAT_V11C300132320 [Lactuca sativa]